MDLDHVFVFVEPGGGAAAAKLDAAGLVANFSRKHVGQGTENRCYVFDNAYLELLWVTDPEVLGSATFYRTQLFQRSRWKSNGASPFGVGVRNATPLPFPCWLWQTPYLPPGLLLEVAKVSAEPRNPFLFRFPGAQRPDHWHDGRGGERQRAAGLAEIAELRLDALPDGEATEHVVIDPGLRPHHAELHLSRVDGGPPRRLALPAFDWLA
ncbi:MAG: VOC family protein [Pseudomonadota bacterium]